MTELARLTFDILAHAWRRRDVMLVDLKIEFGRLASGENQGQLVIADVIDNDSWRIWPQGREDLMLDKQMYRNLETVDDEALANVKRAYERVAELVGSFPVMRPGMVAVDRRLRRRGVEQANEIAGRAGPARPADGASRRESRDHAGVRAAARRSKSRRRSRGWRSWPSANSDSAAHDARCGVVVAGAGRPLDCAAARAAVRQGLWTRRYGAVRPHAVDAGERALERDRGRLVAAAANRGAARGGHWLIAPASPTQRRLVATTSCVAIARHLGASRPPWSCTRSTRSGASIAVTSRAASISRSCRSTAPTWCSVRARTPASAPRRTRRRALRRRGGARVAQPSVAGRAVRRRGDRRRRDRARRAVHGRRGHRGRRIRCASDASTTRLRTTATWRAASSTESARTATRSACRISPATSTSTKASTTIVW